MLKYSQSDSTTGRRIVFLGVAVACTYWFCEGIEDILVYGQGDILEALIPSDIPDLIIRLFACGVAIGFSLYAGSLVKRLLVVNEQYKALFENAPDAIFTADVATGIITDANPAAEKLLLRSHNEIVGLHQSKLHPSKKWDDSTRIFRAHVEDAKKGKEPHPVEHVVLRSDGVEVPVEIMAKTIDLGGRSVLQGILRDVTERRDLYERNAAILKTTTDGFWLLDTTGKVLEVNDAYCRISGYSRDELLKMKIEDVEVIETPQDIAQHIQYIIDTGSSNFETQQRRKDGTIVSLDISANYLPLDGGRIFAFFRDVTELKKLEQELKLSEDRYRTFFENSLTGDFISTSGGALIDCNQAFLDIFGFTSKLEAKSVNMESVYPMPEARDVMLDKIRTEKKIVRYEHEARKMTGEPIIIQQNTVGEFDDDNNLVLMRGHIIDVTDHKRAEQKIAHERDLLQTLMDNTNDYIYFKDRNRRFVRVSNSFCNLFTCPMEDIIGKTDDDFLPPQVAEEVAYDDLQVMEKAMPVINREQGGKLGEKEHWVLTTKLPWRDITGQIIGLFGISRDITLRRSTQDALRESEVKYRTLVEGAGAAISTVNQDGVFLFMNEFAARLLGGRPQDYIGKTMWDIFPKDIAGRQVDSVLKVIHSGSGMNVASLTVVQNESRWYSTSLEPIRDRNSEISSVMVIARDITDHKKAEEQLETYRSEMVRTEMLASMGTVSAMAAHELTQPLTVIQLSIQNAIDELHEEPSSESVRKKLTECLQEVSSITSIVDRFRNFARRSSEQSISEIDLHVVGEKIGGLFSAINRRRGVSLLLMDLEKLPHIRTSEKDIEQIFFALISNAIQAADEKENCQVIVSGTVKDHHVELISSDNCGGIAPENLDMIFEPFFTTKPEGQGTGLGLTIVREILSRLGGKVKVESIFGEGSKFVITLPINNR